MPATPKHDTAVKEGTWDAGENVGRIPDGAGYDVMKRVYAWVDPNGDPKAKSSYKFPHHFVSPQGTPGAASLNGVRNALSRLPQAQIPSADVAGVKAHLQRHLDAAKSVEGHVRAMGGIVTKGDALRCKAIREAAREVDFVASTASVDAHGDSIDQGSWQLDQYKANPVVLFGHMSRELPIGQATRVEVVNGQLECTIKFASPEANPLAENVFRSVMERNLRAVSVGFIPVDGANEMMDGESVWVWRNAILREISVVPVPANPDALAQLKSAFVDAARVDAEEPQPPAEPGQPDTAEGKVDMDKETQEKLEKQAGEIATLKMEATAAKSDADAKSKAAELAEKRATDAEAKVKALEIEKAALEAQTKSLTEARDAATKRVGELEAKTIEQEVEALVGKKITPAEKPLFVDLRKQSPELFEKMIAQRADMPLDKQVIPAEQNGGVKSLDRVARDAAFMKEFEVKKA